MGASQRGDGPAHAGRPLRARRADRLRRHGRGLAGPGHLLGRPVAVKVLRSEYTGDPTFLARFRAEATHAAALSHPNIAAVYDYGEVVSSTTASTSPTWSWSSCTASRCRPCCASEGPLGTEATLSVLRQTAVALAEAHHVGLVHRDVKPGNILVAPGRPGEDHRLRHRLVGRQRAAHPGRPGARHPAVPLAGDGGRRAAHPRLRRLLPRPGRLRVPHRSARVHRGQPGDRGPQAGGGGPAAAAGRPARRACANWWTSRSPRTPASGSPTATRSSPRSTGCGPATPRPPAGPTPGRSPGRVRQRPRGRRRPGARGGCATLLPAVAALLVGVGVVVALALTRGGATPAAADAPPGPVSSPRRSRRSRWTAPATSAVRSTRWPLELAALGLTVDRRAAGGGRRADRDA